MPFEEIDYTGAGVNHQAWLLRFEHRGESLYPRLDELLERDPELRRRVRMDMYRRLGYFPTETSEHSSEYVPWYLHDDEEIARLRIPVGDYLQISAGQRGRVPRGARRRCWPASRSTSAGTPPSTRRRSSTAWSPAPCGGSTATSPTAA